MADARYVIDLILKARDDFSQTFNEAIGKQQEYKAAVKDSERTVRESNDRVRESNLRVAESHTALRNKTVDSTGTISRQFQQLDKDADKARRSMADLSIEIREQQPVVDALRKKHEDAAKAVDDLTKAQEGATKVSKREREALAKRIADSRVAQAEYEKEKSKLTALTTAQDEHSLALQKNRNEYGKLKQAFERDERANQLERQIVLIEQLTDRTVKLAADTRASDQQRLNAQKELSAAVRDYQVLLYQGKDISKALGDAENERAANEVRMNRERKVQEEEILRLRKDLLSVSKQIGRETNVREVDLLRRKADELAEALKRVGANRDRFSEIMEESVAAEIMEAEAFALKEQERLQKEIDRAQRERNREAEKNARAAMARSQEQARQGQAEGRRRQQEAREQIRLETEYAKAIDRAAKSEIDRRRAKSQAAAGEITGDDAAIIAARAQADVASARAAKQALESAMGTQLDVPVNVELGKAIAEVMAFRALAERPLDMRGRGGTSIVGGLIENFETASSRISQFDNFLRGLLTLGITVFFNQLITLAGAAAGALAALASSAAMAGAAIGGALSAGIAQALPVLGLFATAIARVAAVMKAVQQANLLEEQQAAGRQRNANREASAADQIRSANEALADSHRRVGDAHDRVRQAQKNLTDSREQARQKLEDLILAERGLAISSEEAQERLRRAISSGDTGAIQAAQLRRDELNARMRRNRQELSGRRAAGIGGSPEVSQARQQLDAAVEGVRDAEQAVVRAERAVERARRSSSVAGEDALAAAGKLNFLLGEMSSSERRLYDSMRRIQDTFRRFAQRVSAPIIEAFSFAIDRVGGLLRNNRVIGGFLSLARSVATQIRRIVREMTDRESISRWLRLMEQAQRNMRPLTSIFLTFSDAFLGIAEAAGPAFREILDWLGQLTRRFANWTNSAQGQETLGNLFREGVVHLKEWMRLLGSIGDLFIAIAGPGGGADAGLRMVQGMTRTFERLAQKVRANRDEMREFFDTTIAVIRELRPLFSALLEQFLLIFTPTAVRSFVSFLTDILIPALGQVMRMFGDIANIIAAISDIPVLGVIFQFLTKWAIAGTVFVGVLLKISTVLKPLVGVFGAFLTQTARGRGIMSRFGLTFDESSGKILGWGNALKTATRFAGGLVTQIGTLLSKIPLLNRLSGPLSNLGGRISARGAPGAPGSASGPGGPVVAPVPGGRSSPDSTKRSAGSRAAKGFGIAAIVSMFLPDAVGGQRDIGEDVAAGFNNFGQQLENGINRVGGSLKKLTSLNFGGAFKQFTRNNSDMTDFGNNFDDTMKKLVKEENIEGLRKQAERARELAEEWPEYAEGLEEAATQADQAAEHFEELRRRVGSLRTRFKETFDKGLVKAEDVIDSQESRNALAQFLSNLNRIRVSGIRSISDLRSNIRFNTEQINKAFEIGSESWAINMGRNFGSGIQAVKKAMKDGTLSTKEGMQEINRLTRQNMRFARDNMDTLSADGKAKLGQNMMKAAEAVKKQMDAAGKTTESGMRKVRRLMVKGLELYGFTEEQAIRYTENRDPLTGKSMSAPLVGKAVGGFIGQPGERGKDQVHAILGRGEAVLNWAQQRALNAILPGQMTVADIINRVRGYHAGGMEQPGFAGGYAGKTPYGRMVEIPGQPGEFVHKRIVNSVVQMMRRFNMAVTDGFATSGHAPGGDHPKGLGVDFVPGAGGNWNKVDQAAAYARSKLGSIFRWIGYDGVPNHGRGHHLHLSWLANSKTLGAMAAALIQIKNLAVKGGGYMGAQVQGALNMNTAAANSLLRKAFNDSFPEQGPGGYEAHPTGKGVLPEGAVRSVIRRAMNLVGVPDSLRSSWAQMAYARARQESGFNPNAVNQWDSNAKAGTPSIGLFQTIGPTFAAYMMRGMNNIRNPLHNAVAAFNYMFSRYGGGKSWQTALQRMFGLAGVGYATGGIVPGDYEGAPQPILAHAGEWVINPRQQNMIAQMVGASVGKIRAALGFSGGPTSFQGGGEVRRLPSAYTMGTPEPDTFRGFDREMARAQRLLRRFAEAGRKGLDRFNKSMENITQEDGLLDRFSEITGKFAENMEQRLRQRMYRVRRVTENGRTRFVVSRRENLDEEGEVLNAEIRNLERLRVRLREGQQDLNRLMKRNTRRLKAIDERMEKYRAELRQARQSGDDDAVKDVQKRIDTLKDQRGQTVGARQNLKERLRQSQKALTDNLASLYESQMKRFEMDTEAAMKSFETKRDVGGGLTVGLDALINLVSRRGGDVVGLSRERLADMQEQFDFLKERQREAQARGFHDYATSLGTQLETLWGEIQSATDDLLQMEVDAITKRADRRERARGLETRVADLRQRVGDALGASVAREGIVRGRGDDLVVQNRELRDLISRVDQNTHPELYQNLADQLEENELAIRENTQDVRDAASETRRLRIDMISQRGQMQTGIIGGLRGIVNTVGQITGQTTSATLAELQAAEAQSLAETGGGLREQLLEMTGVDLRGLSGLDFVSAMQNLLPRLDAMMEGMTEADRAIFQNLIDGIIANEQAVQDNTAATNELSGQMNQPQGFSSSAWQWFREAIFTGMGDVMPQYQIPQMQTGGYVTKGGLFQLHTGEFVVNAEGKNMPVSEGDVNITVNEAGRPLDLTHLANRLAFAKKTRL